MKLVIENIVITSMATQEVLLGVWDTAHKLYFTTDGKFDTVVLENDDEKITYNFPSKDVTNKIVQRKEQ